MVINKLICKGVPSHTCSIKIVITSKSKEGLRSLDKDRLPDERFLDRRRPFFYSFSSIKLEQNKQNRNLYSPSCLNVLIQCFWESLPCWEILLCCSSFPSTASSSTPRSLSGVISATSLKIQSSTWIHPQSSCYQRWPFICQPQRSSSKTIFDWLGQTVF